MTLLSFVDDDDDGDAFFCCFALLSFFPVIVLIIKKKLKKYILTLFLTLFRIYDNWTTLQKIKRKKKF